MTEFKKPETYIHLLLKSAKMMLAAGEKIEAISLLFSNGVDDEQGIVKPMIIPDYLDSKNDYEDSLIEVCDEDNIEAVVLQHSYTFLPDELLNKITLFPGTDISQVKDAKTLIFYNWEYIENNNIHKGVDFYEVGLNDKDESELIPGDYDEYDKEIKLNTMKNILKIENIPIVDVNSKKKKEVINVDFEKKEKIEDRKPN